MKKWFYFLFLFIGFISCKENTNTKAQKDSLSGDRVLIIDSVEGNIVVESENATAKKLFKQSLPFMIKVYELDPKAEKALESLQGIYSALLDEEKANEFKQKKEALNKK